MTTVTSAELQKNFGRYGEIAQREPVMVTNHGRESLVLLSADAYRRLATLDTRTVVAAGELSPEALVALRSDDIDPECAKFDHEMDD
ncbi:MAG: type II toxin-antitoxin system Phd/YefM family antitoxin [Stappiaceae bacterium]